MSFKRNVALKTKVSRLYACEHIFAYLKKEDATPLVDRLDKIRVQKGSIRFTFNDYLSDHRSLSATVDFGKLEVHSHQLRSDGELTKIICRVGNAARTEHKASRSR
jgi:hypothetical protein